MKDSSKRKAEKTKVLLAHNRYLISGGERQVFQAELNLLRENGHVVQVYIEDNQRVAALGKARTAARTIWSSETYQVVRRRLRESEIDIVHVHNFFPLISPSIYYAAQAERVAVVQTIHNFRLLCVNGFLFREGAVCEDCVGRSVPWPAVLNSCYRGSRSGSATAAAMLSFHRAIKTWDRMVDVYIALTEFSRQKLIEGGLPGDRILLKPNFVSAVPDHARKRGDFALFVGRLSPEKGVRTLLSAWQKLEPPVPLRIVGDGPLSEEVIAKTESMPAVQYLGRIENDEVISLMERAQFLVFPSLWYENFPMTIVEAFAAGLPVLASDLGNTASLVQSGQTGLHFEAGDADALAEQVQWLTRHPEQRQRMGLAGRQTFEQQFTPEKNYQFLNVIYERAIATRQETG